MKKLLPFIFAFVTLGACDVATSTSPWDGTYSYGAYGGRTVGGSAMLIEITVSINNPELKHPCVFQAMGFQTDKYYVCSTTIKDDTLEVRFESDRDGYAEKRYKRGEVLLTLKRPKNQENKYVVHWGSYIPFSDMSKADDYFTKKK